MSMGKSVECAVAGFGRHIRRRWTAWMLGTLLFFLFFPNIDLIVSGWFYDPATHGWAMNGTPLGDFVRKGVPPLLVGLVLFLAVLWLAGKVYRQRFLGVTGPVVLYLVLSLAIGPGFLANTVFKDNWGRARPSTVQELGGDRQFTPPFMVTDQCDRNCSFVSGHGALGFWLVALAFLAPGAWRGRAIVVALVGGSWVGFVRIAQGGHFLSDVFYAGVLVVTVSWFLHRWIVGTAPVRDDLSSAAD